MTDVERDVAFTLADLSGYVALTEAHGSREAAGVIDRYLAVADAARMPAARLVERAGDQLVFAADAPRDAVLTALRLREAVAREPMFPRVRAGVHQGRVLERDGAYYGAALNVAARVVDRAAPGQVLCTETVAHAARGLPGVTVQPLGPVALRHLAEPLALFEITAPAGAAVVIDPVCQMQLTPASAVASASHEGIVRYFCSEPCAAAFARRPDAYAAR
ncbi:MAG TPA: hypothetical protein VFL90_01995 [Methylomirabilota bacterium]|nr:hypothetical protein [Methylomirabilota bacterium]